MSGERDGLAWGRLRAWVGGMGRKRWVGGWAGEMSWWLDKGDGGMGLGLARMEEERKKIKGERVRL